MFRILHIDDDDDIRLIVDTALQFEPDFEARSCASGPEGIAVAMDWSPHLILCDVAMPGVDGPATLARLRQVPWTRTVPLVFMTGYAREDELRHYVSLGAAGVITKPFSPTRLGAQVRRYLERTARLDGGMGPEAGAER